VEKGYGGAETRYIDNIEGNLRKNRLATDIFNKYDAFDSRFRSRNHVGKRIPRNARRAL
jgi:hypothetical protein